MWSTIFAIGTKITSMVPALGFVTKFFSNSSDNKTSSTKIKVMFVILILLVLYIGWLKWDISDLHDEITYHKDKNIALELQNTEYKNTNELLKTSNTLRAEETDNINDLLKQCYAQIERTTLEYDTIYQNMIQGSTGTELNLNEKGEPTYDRVTKEQNESGINFINNMLNTIK